jgi:hypothetical protein
MWICHARWVPSRWFWWSSRAWCAFVGIIFASLLGLLVLLVAGALLSRSTFSASTVLIVWTVLYSGWAVRSLAVVLAVSDNGDVMVRNPLRAYRIRSEMVEVITDAGPLIYKDAVCLAFKVHGRRRPVPVLACAAWLPAGVRRLESIAAVLGDRLGARVTGRLWSPS